MVLELFFLAHIKLIELKPFSLNQAYQNTSLQYQQGVAGSMEHFERSWSGFFKNIGCPTVKICSPLGAQAGAFFDFLLGKILE